MVLAVRKMLIASVALALISHSVAEAKRRTSRTSKTAKPAVTDVSDANPRESTVSLAAWALRAAKEEAVAALSNADRVEVNLYDENQQEHATIVLGRDGSMDGDTAKEVKRLFKCRRSGRERNIDRGTLSMLADLAVKYPGKTIEYVSVYRGNSEESRTSPHRAGRAIDFRIRGVNPTEIRDYLWRTYSEVGIGWYPQESFIHMDHRPGEKDIAWTFLKGDNFYNPGWSAVARSKDPAKKIRREPGV
jgi:uncharacterized protein YcbK (DUF882 family)